MIKTFYLFFFVCFYSCQAYSHEPQELYLKDNLKQARIGDYIVTSACKNLTLLHIYDKNDSILTIEEISVPQKYRPDNWKSWVSSNAPKHSQWVLYEINLQTGRRIRSYSFTKGYWFEIADSDDLLSKILNLKLTKIPESSRKKIGPKPKSGPDMRLTWQPTLIHDGKAIRGISFDAWRTKWPIDQSDLSGKLIEVYVPQDNQRFPSYFPYWLQIHGAMGKANIRIIDSGTQLQSNKLPLSSL